MEILLRLWCEFSEWEEPLAVFLFVLSESPHSKHPEQTKNRTKGAMLQNLTKFKQWELPTNRVKLTNQLHKNEKKVKYPYNAAKEVWMDKLEGDWNGLKLWFLKAF